jgi:hypothetical protein
VQQDSAARLKRQSTVSHRSGGGNYTEQLVSHHTRTDTIQPVPIHIASAVGLPVSGPMNIDMTLATSYKPVLVCIVKVCILMVFHYASVPILFATERYALIVAMLYIDKWLAHEYIVNTNSCTAVLAGSLLVHELRDAGVQERLHGEFAHNVVLSMLVGCNILVMALGEHQTIFNLFVPSHQSSCAVTTGSIPDALSDEYSDVNNKRLRQQLYTNTHQSLAFQSKVPYSIGPFTCVVGISMLLVVLSTCAMPMSAHDPLLNNLRVWSFTVLSLTWLYTVNYKDLRYSVVAPFTPCLLRFSGVLFLTPTPVAIAGIVLMAACLFSTHIWLNKHQQSPYDMCTPDNIHQGIGCDSVAVVVRETKTPSHTQTGSAVSYRNPSVIQESSDSMVVGVKGVQSGLVPNLARAAMESPNSYVAKPEMSCKIDDYDTGSIAIPIPDASVDYDSMFLQAMSEQTG